MGVVTARDEWVYDFEKENVAKKVDFLIKTYNKEVDKHKGKTTNEINNEINYEIKWSRAVKNDLQKGKKYTFEESKIVESLYRPFTKKWLYFSKELNEMQYQIPSILGGFNVKDEKMILISSGHRANFSVLAFTKTPCYDIFMPNACQCLPLYRYENGKQVENITDWALQQFRERYAPPAPPEGGSKNHRVPPEGGSKNHRVPPEGGVRTIEFPPSGEKKPPLLLPPFGGAGGGQDLQELLPPFGVVGGEQDPLPLFPPFGRAEEETRNFFATLPYMKEIRKELRNNLTTAEAYFWLYVQNKQLLGRKFRRQHSFGSYVVDFYCHSEKLVIELDGAAHYTSQGMEYDEARTLFLESLGLTVVRFENKDVLAHIESVLAYLTSLFSIEKEDIFHYVYAVLHNPAYRQKYELNLKREFPRIPFYADFWQWAAWGKELMDLHIDYEKVAPFPLKRKEVIKGSAGFENPPNLTTPKPKLKAFKDKGHIEIDELTTLTDIPAEAWEYKLGNRSALEWILDQYKESKPSDPTILAKFNTYQFADNKEVVIDLLMRVCTVSVETQRIVGEMGK